MTGDLLTTASTIQCTHGGKALLVTKNSHLQAGGAPVLLETDVHAVLGCPFTVGTKYSPCVRIEWSQGSTEVSANGTPVLVTTSVGKCLSAEGATQGKAIVTATQRKAAAG